MCHQVIIVGSTPDPETPLTFHPEENEYTRPIGSKSNIVTIVVSLAILQGGGLSDVTPLDESIDVDGLESVASQLVDGSLTLEGRLSFTHDGYRISLDSDHLLHFSPIGTPSQ